MFYDLSNDASAEVLETLINHGGSHLTGATFCLSTIFRPAVPFQAMFDMPIVDGILHPSIHLSLGA